MFHHIVEFTRNDLFEILIYNFEIKFNEMLNISIY